MIHENTPAPRTSVIINCYNGEKYLREAIESVFHQTDQDWEIIFWDNASTDRSSEIALSFGNKLHYFRSKENVPLGKARNLAINKARGLYIAFLDSDDLWMPSKLEKQIPLFEKNANVALVFCDTIFFNKEREIKQIYRKNKPPKGRVFDKLLSDYFLSMETTVIRKSSLDQLDYGFDDTLELAGDVELFLRLAYRFDVDYIDEPLAKWRVHAQSDTHTKYRLFAFEKQKILDHWLTTVPNLEHSFPKEIGSLRKKIRLQKALSEWSSGNHHKLRTIIGNERWSDFKMFIVYWLSFMPTPVFQACWDIYRKY